MKRLAIIRHGVAADMSPDGSDAGRPLTEEGHEKLRKQLPLLKVLLKGVTSFVTSPLVRSIQTAEEILKGLPCQNVFATDFLRPDMAPRDVIIYLNEMAEQLGDFPVLIGHQPHLGSLVGYLESGSQSRYYDIKKGSLVIFETRIPLNPGEPELRCFLQPREIREISLSL